MGYIRHHAIIVTSWDKELLFKAHNRAIEIFDMETKSISEILTARCNDTYSFFISPDGSKEGWKESQEGDIHREQFKYWLKKQTHNDGSSSLSWVEVQYGDDDNITKIVDSSDDEHNRIYQEFNKERS